MRSPHILVHTLLCLALAALAGGCGGAPGIFSATSFLGKVPPELATVGTSLNSDEPLQLANLRGQVVWLEFSFLNEYASQGLKIIEVDDGEIDSLEELREHVRSEQIPFAVFHDETGAVCRSYGVQGYPVAYLIGETGEVLWEGIPSFDPEEAENLVQLALAGNLRPPSRSDVQP